MRRPSAALSVIVLVLCAEAAVQARPNQHRQLVVNLGTMPSDVTDKILDEHGLDLTHLGYLSLEIPNLRRQFLDRVVQALLYRDKTPAWMVAPLIRILIAHMDHDHAVKQYVTQLVSPQMAMGLYHRIRWTKVFSRSLKAELCLLLLRNLNQPVLNFIPSSYPMFLSGPGAIFPGFPDLHTPVPENILDKIPESILSIVKGFLSERPSVRHDDSDAILAEQCRERGFLLGTDSPCDTATCCAVIRDRYPEPFCHVVLHSTEIAQALLKFPDFSPETHPLRDPETVLALRHLGITFFYQQFFEHVQIPLENISLIFPLLKCPGVFGIVECLHSYISEALLDLARELIKIPYVEHCIRMDPSHLFRNAALVDNSVAVYEFIIGLPYISKIINIPTFRKSTQTVLSFVLETGQYRLAEVLLQVPSIQVNLDDVFKDMNRTGYEEFINGERFSHWILSHTGELMQFLRVQVPDSTHDRYHRISSFQWFSQIPYEERMQYVIFAHRNAQS